MKEARGMPKTVNSQKVMSIWRVKCGYGSFLIEVVIFLVYVTSTDTIERWAIR